MTNIFPIMAWVRKYQVTSFEQLDTKHIWDGTRLMWHYIYAVYTNKQIQCYTCCMKLRITASCESVFYFPFLSFFTFHVIVRHYRCIITIFFQSMQHDITKTLGSLWDRTIWITPHQLKLINIQPKKVSVDVTIWGVWLFYALFWQ